MKSLMKIPFILLMLAPPILILLIALLMLYIPLPAPFPPAGSHARNLPAAITTGILGLAWVAILIIFVINSFLSAGHVLDSAFSSLGFKGSNYLIIGRQYQGSKESRKITAQYLPGLTLQNPLFEIRVETNTNENMAIGREKPLLGCVDCRKVDTTSIQLENFQIYAQDITRAQETLKEPKIANLIIRLMDESDGAGFREVYIQPGSIWLHSRSSVKFEEKNIQNYLDLLLDLAEIIERSN